MTESDKVKEAVTRGFISLMEAVHLPLIDCLDSEEATAIVAGIRKAVDRSLMAVAAQATGSQEGFEIVVVLDKRLREEMIRFLASGFDGEPESSLKSAVVRSLQDVREKTNSLRMMAEAAKDTYRFLNGEKLLRAQKLDLEVKALKENVRTGGQSRW